jgi:hypothetical protein
MMVHLSSRLRLPTLDKLDIQTSLPYFSLTRSMTKTLLIASANVE